MRKIKLSALIFSAAIFGVALQVRAYEKLPLYETLPEWTLVWTDANHSKGTIETDVAHGGWKIHVARADAERALAPDGVTGVYREGARKAWFVDTPSPFDPNGLLLLLR